MSFDKHGIMLIAISIIAFIVIYTAVFNEVKIMIKSRKESKQPKKNATTREAGREDMSGGETQQADTIVREFQQADTIVRESQQADTIRHKPQSADNIDRETKKINIISRESNHVASCNELQQDAHIKEHNLPQPESRLNEEQQSLPRLKIVINSKSEYEPEQWDEPFQFPNKTPNPQNDERRYLILNKHTFQKLKDSLNWGKRTERNKVEQGGVLLGHTAYYRNEIYCFVNDFLLADTTGDPVFVEFTSEMWAAMQSGLAEINTTRGRNEQLVIVGWFHTHPNGLSVFMSGTDMNTQRLNFSLDWQVSLVMNPHTNKYRAFFGAKATEGKVIFHDGKS